MSRKKKKRRESKSSEMSLNITAMADIFTIILVFLLKSFSSGSLNLSPTSGLLLPHAHGQSANFEALKIEITDGMIQVEGEPVTPLKNFSTSSKDKAGNGSLRSLNKVLRSARNKQVAIAKQNPEVKIDSKVLIVSDKRTPYRTIKSVLASAAVNGYTDFKLAVVRDQ